MRERLSRRGKYGESGRIAHPAKCFRKHHSMFSRAAPTAQPRGRVVESSSCAPTQLASSVKPWISRRPTGPISLQSFLQAWSLPRTALKKTLRLPGPRRSSAAPGASWPGSPRASNGPTPGLESCRPSIGEQACPDRAGGTLRAHRGVSPVSGEALPVGHRARRRHRRDSRPDHPFSQGRSPVPRVPRDLGVHRAPVAKFPYHIVYKKAGKMPAFPEGARSNSCRNRTILGSGDL